jgi:Spy/CpxP family protein refolding chaperone
MANPLVHFFDMRPVKTFSLLATFFLVVPVFGQGKKPISAPSHSLGQLQKELKLTAKQKKEWTRIIGQYRPRVKTVQDKYVPRLTALHTQLQRVSGQMTQELRPTLEARRRELEAVLTPEQRKKKESLNAALKVAIQRRLATGNRRP